MEDLIPLTPDAAEFEVALEEWKRLAISANGLRACADNVYTDAYLNCPPNGDGKPAAEHLRKVHADREAIGTEVAATDAAIAAQAARFRVEFLIKRAGRQ